MKIRTIVFLTALALVLALPAMAAGPDGAAIYKAKCSACHGVDGSGQTPVGKSMKIRDLRSAEVQKQTDIQLTDIIAGGKGKMQGYGKTLSTADIQALIAHIRTLKK
ncbi:MAG TPA: cytochrome c [Thermoanaerobaculia bacterium]|jgi:mono/diheme cytochrome c family protein|nr:cytochrome c [Thermoanaerobaculia bacterium]